MNNRKKKGNKAHDQTLCFDCCWSTRPWKCPWVDENKPVKGWLARENIVSPRSSPFKSYHVIACPKFKRNSYCGGLIDPPNKERVYLDPKDVPSVAEAICEQAVVDWIALDYGALDSLKFCGQVVKRDELLEFFFGRWFAELLESFSPRTPQQVRRAIRIPGDTIMDWRGARS